MKKSSKNVIKQMVDSNYKSMSEKTKENLFGASNAVFNNKK